MSLADGNFQPGIMVFYGVKRDVKINSKKYKKYVKNPCNFYKYSI